MNGVVYFIRSGVRGPIKIGYTRNLAHRISQLQSGSPKPLRLLGSYPGTRELETMVQAIFGAHRIRGEWFQPCPDLLKVARGDLAPLGQAADLFIHEPVAA